MCTKRVQKDDLSNFIKECYADTVSLTHPDRHPIDVSINPFIIKITDTLDFDSTESQNNRLDDFAFNIERATFDNLKVIGKICAKQEGITCITTITIACNYEVIFD